MQGLLFLDASGQSWVPGRAPGPVRSPQIVGSKSSGPARRSIRQWAQARRGAVLKHYHIRHQTTGQRYPPLSADIAPELAWGNADLLAGGLWAGFYVVLDASISVSGRVSHVVKLFNTKELAERERFELSIRFPVCPLSRRVVSTAHAPLRAADLGGYGAKPICCHHSR